MARTPVERGGKPALLRPVASPVDTFIQPAPSNLRGFADALGKIDGGLRAFLKGRDEKADEDERLRGEAAFYKNNGEGYAEAIRRGRIPAHASPDFVDAYKTAQGNVAGHEVKDNFWKAYDAWEGKHADGADFDGFLGEWVKTNLNTDDPKVLKGLLPHIRELQQNGRAKYNADRHNQVYNGSLNAHIAGANRAIDQGDLEGQATEGGTDYAVVFKSISDNRAIWIKTGGRPEDFDKPMIDAMAAKVLALRDPGLLAWFDQKIPGTDRTYGEDPYGAIVKKNTVASLEVIARRHVSEENAKLTAEEKAAREAVHRQAIELLASDPATVIPDELLLEGIKADPTFRVRVEEWRKNLGNGFSDPARIKAVYATILEGESNAHQVVQDAFTEGVFGRPEDLTAAYNFAKGFEDNRDRIETTLGSGVSRSFLEAIEIRTKGQTKLFEPIAGISNEGAEAIYDYRRLVKDWVINNPDADSFQTEEAINKIGKLVLDRITEASVIDGGTYERPEELGDAFDNPFSPDRPEQQGPLVAPQQEEPEEPEPVEKKAEVDPEILGETEDFLNGLTDEQRAAIQEQAAESGVSETDIATQMLDSNFNPDPLVGDDDTTEAVPVEEEPQGQPPSIAEHFFKDEPPKLEDLPQEIRDYLEPIIERNGMSFDEFSKNLWERLRDRTQSDQGTEDEDRSISDPEVHKMAFSTREGTARPLTHTDVRHVPLSAEDAESFLDQALLLGKDAAYTPEADTGDGEARPADRQAGILLDLIGKHEAAGNYNAVYQKAGSKAELSKLTLDQILSSQVAARRRGVKSTAIGRYQFVYKTLRGLKYELGLSGKERFTPRLQDQLGLALLHRRGWAAFKAGKLSKRQFAFRLSQEWAALPNPNTGRSYYAGDGLNASSVSTAAVYRTLGFVASRKSGTPI